jgi:hypothetical protein
LWLNFAAIFSPALPEFVLTLGGKDKMEEFSSLRERKAKDMANEDVNLSALLREVETQHLDGDVEDLLDLRSQLVAAVDDCGSSTLPQLERVIETGTRAIGTALREIRDRRLYKDSYTNFEAYCRERWGFSRMTASRHIRTASVTHALLNEGMPAPTSQRAALAMEPKKKKAKLAPKPEPEPETAPAPDPEPTPPPQSESKALKLRDKVADAFGEITVSPGRNSGEYDFTIWNILETEILEYAAWRRQRRTT